jgi:hypothetical protein
MIFDAAEEGSGVGFEIEIGEAVLALGTFAHFAFEEIGDELLAVADAEDGNIAGEKGRIDRGAACFINAGRAAGDDDGPGVFELGEACFAGPDFGVDALFADFARDEMGVLTTRI